MKVVTIGRGLCGLDKLSELRKNPIFRKATANMMIAFDSILQATHGLPTLHSPGFIVGTRHGEIETTKEFLKTLGNTGIARPILFQNSLHNGTLGFLALELSLTGPSFTVSDPRDPLEKAKDLAEQLLVANIVSVCLVTAVDVMSEELKPAFERVVQDPKFFTDRAESLVLTTEKFAKENGISIL